MKKFLALSASALCLLTCSPAVTDATDLAYHISEDSISYFTDPEEIIVSAKNKFQLDRFSGVYGFAFTPQEDGTYVLTKVNGEDIESDVITRKDGRIYVDKVSYYTSKNIDSDIIGFSNEYISSGDYFIFYDFIDSDKNRSEFVVEGNLEEISGIYDGNYPQVVASENSRLARKEISSPGFVYSSLRTYYVFEPSANGVTTLIFPYYDCPTTYMISSANGLYIPSLNIVKDVPTLSGDINGDGKVNISDIVSLQRYILSAEDFTAAQFLSADMNNDGNVDIYDMIEMRKKIIEN